ncbi:NAD(P)-dependent oxidoreductase [Sneathiella chinensis]|uniref:Oxidoreductase n=1 Tax=Sneathiella chinensis TaxID=349750 RepID=A0ABQ5U7B1_9PROT|nr:NAD(P)-dependent oxidoreductase [Sneathiella chinensis]GLQ07311.1 oxidoreductase [Sneathiella chinensis]
MTKVAFIGIGNMGFGMASRLMDAGHDLTVYNRTAEKAAPLVEAGARLASSPHDAAKDAEVIMTMLGDDDACRTVWHGEDGILSGPLRPDAVAIECSTLSYEWILEHARLVEKAGPAFLDCPVNGVPAQAVSGDLMLLLGGNKDLIARLQDILKPLSSSQRHFGGIGAGTAFKLIVNLMSSVQIQALAEGLYAADKAGLDLETVVQTLGDSACGSDQVKRNGPVMLAGKFDENVTFAAKWRLKDTRYAVDFEKSVGFNPGLGIETLNRLQQLVDDGFGNSNGARVIETLQKD